MLVDGSRFKELYDAVNQEKHQSEDKSIMVFVAHSNVDAICASRQLQVRVQARGGLAGLGCCACPCEQAARQFAYS